MTVKKDSEIKVSVCCQTFKKKQLDIQHRIEVMSQKSFGSFQWVDVSRSPPASLTGSTTPDDQVMVKELEAELQAAKGKQRQLEELCKQLQVEKQKWHSEAVKQANTPNDFSKMLAKEILEQNNLLMESKNIVEKQGLVSRQRAEEIKMLRSQVEQLKKMLSESDGSDAKSQNLLDEKKTSSSRDEMDYFDDNDALKKEVDEVKAKLIEMEKENRALKAEVVEANEELEVRDQDVIDKIKEINALEWKNKWFKKQLEQLNHDKESESAKFNSDYLTLVDATKIDKKTIEELKTELEASMKDTADLKNLQRDHLKLKNDFKTLIDISERLEMNYKAIQGQFRVIQADNTRLRAGGKSGVTTDENLSQMNLSNDVSENA